MNKNELDRAVNTAKQQTKVALQMVYNELNHGQQKKIIKNEEVKKLFDLYGVEYQE